jgi:hypothetical protein
VGVKSRREINFERDAKLFVKKYGQVLSASKQVFGVTVSLLQLLSSLKEVLTEDNLGKPNRTCRGHLKLQAAAH